METLATVVPDSGDNQNIVPLAQSNGTGQQVMCLAPWGTLAAADVDNVCPLLDCLLDGSREVQLGEPTLLKVAKDREDKTSAARGDPEHSTIGLPEDQAGDVRTMIRHRSGASRIGNQSVETGEVSSPEAGMRQVGGPVEYGYAYFRITKRLALEECEFGNHGQDISSDNPVRSHSAQLPIERYTSQQHNVNHFYPVAK